MPRQTKEDAIDLSKYPVICCELCASCIVQGIMYRTKHGCVCRECKEDLDQSESFYFDGIAERPYATTDEAGSDR